MAPVYLSISCMITALSLILGSSAGSTPPSLDSSSDLLVDLGYAQYTGYFDNSTNLNLWKGIRYAQAERWQAPKVPDTNTTVVQASAFGPMCPQSPLAVGPVPFVQGDEDCLYLNVYSPSQPSPGGLPVLIYIHNGGYGLGDGTQDMSAIINSNNNTFLAVAIQYRLGAFGFLSSAEVMAKGVLNAGLLDQAFAFQWVQDHIAKFGGDPTRVSISGESAGGGSVMLHAMAQGGTVGNKLWQNAIASSPYNPGNYPYNASYPTKLYYDFSNWAGCGSSGEVFDCLVGKDSLTVQYASANISQEGPYASWAFVPVTDYSYVADLPSVQLNEKKVNGDRLLIGNNANEGSLFVPTNITTQDDLIAWIQSNFPDLSDSQIQQVLATYPSPSGPDNPNATKIETNGIDPPYAINVSQAATGHQQQAFAIYAEVILDCPGYWMGYGFTGNNKTAHHYQYSVPFASHAADVSAILGPATPNQGPDFTLAIRKIWGNFITTNDPSIPDAIANGASAASANASNPASNWPAWTDENPMMISLNETGGVPSQESEGAVNVTIYTGSGLRNSFTLANAYTWEGGRGQRCDFWKSIGQSIHG